MAKLALHELRRLEVPLETAVDAVLDLDSEQGGLLAFGPILEARIESGEQSGLSIVVQRRGTEGTERRIFELPLLAAALIRYCWKCRIPLPRHGNKRIEVGPGGFVFTIEGTVQVVRRHAALPKGSAPAQAPTSHEPERADDPTGEPEEAIEVAAS